MPIVQTNQGDLAVVELLRQAWNGTTKLRVHLYGNNYVPVEGSTPVNFVECDFPGYASQIALGWTPAHMVGLHARTEADPCVFSLSSTPGSPVTVYGFWIQRTDELTTCWWAGRFDPPVVLADAGQGIALYLTYSNNRE